MKLLLFIASCCLILYCIASIITTGADNAQKQLELDKLSAEISGLENENEELNAILNECDEKTYMENIAMELLGYAYPNERRFYNTSRN